MELDRSFSFMKGQLEKTAKNFTIVSMRKNKTRPNSMQFIKKHAEYKISEK